MTKPTEQTFLNLCYPRSDKDSQLELRDEFIQQFKDSNLDPFLDGYGNLYVTIGATNVAFTSHLDNVDRGTSKHNKLSTSKGIVSLHPDSESTCLGADDAAGLFIMLTMIHNRVPGLYCFFLDEEIGCLGSIHASTYEQHIFENIDHMISFDRKGYSSVITHQMGEQCCSTEFSTALCDQLTNLAPCKFNPDPNGSYTDSYSFIHMITNCTNLSVGYFNQHTRQETQDLDYLLAIAEVYSKVNWSDLPVVPFTTQPSTYAQYNEDYHALQTIYDQIDDLIYFNPDLAPYIKEDLTLLLEQYELDSTDPFYFKD